MKQNKTTVIGLTGGIATGKSTVSNILKEKGYKIIDADKIAKDIVDINCPAYNDIVQYFGKNILNKDKSINRAYLAEKIFADQILREKLNEITHPRIIEKIKEEIEISNKEDIIFLDIPLLLEIKDSFKEYDVYMDEIWLVYCDENTTVERLMKRNNLNYEEAMKRIKSQISIEEKRKLADTIIDNTGDTDNLMRNVEKALQKTS